MSTKRLIRGGLAAVFLPAALLAPVALRALAPQTSSVADKGSIAQSYAKLPLRFEANSGQTDPSVRFLARSGGATVYLTDSEAVFSLPHGRVRPGGVLPDGASPHAVRMRPLGASSAAVPEGIERLPGLSNYLLGSDPSRWRTGVPSYTGVRYTDLYPGIDLVFHGKSEALEYDFVVAPGGDPSTIALGFEGAEELKIGSSGDLVVSTSSGEIRQRRPRLYQDVGGIRRSVSGEFLLNGPNRVGFRVGDYDRRLPLVIDPVVSFSTLLGGSGDESGAGLAIDVAGNPYVAGTTNSLDFPTNAGASDRICDTGTPETCNGDAYVTKLTPDGSGVVYSTYIGGTATDRGKSVSVDDQGRVVVYGDTHSNDFPTTENGFDRTCGDPGDPAERCMDVFVAQVAVDGATLAYATFVGGSDDDWAGRRGDPFDNFASQGVAVTSGGTSAEGIWVTGTTLSSDFPATPEHPEDLQAKGYDLFCGTGVNPLTGLPDGSCNSDAHFTDGVTTNESTTLTSASANFSSSDVGRTITGEHIPAGTVVSEQVNTTTLVLSAPATATDASTIFTLVGRNERQSDAFVAKILPQRSGSTSLFNATYFGGGRADSGNGIAIHLDTNHGEDYGLVTGATGGLDFPTTPQAFDRTCGAQGDPAGACPDGGTDAFVAKLAASRVLLHSTYLGGSGQDTGVAVAADHPGNVYVTGETTSAGFPTKNAFQAELAGSNDAFVTKMVPDTSALVFSTFLGGSTNRRSNIGGNDHGNGISVDGARNVYVSGTTSADDFPSADPVQAFAGFNTDAFVAKLGASGSTVVYSTPLGGAGDEFGGAVALDPGGTASIAGTTGDSSTFPTPEGSVRSGPGGSREAFVVKLGQGTTPVVAAISPPGGSILGGTPVVITGSGLAGVTAVRFGDAAASSFVVNSDSRITAVSPAHGGTTFEELTVSVTVTSPQGTSFNAVPYVYGEGAFHATRSCLGVCPHGGRMVTLPNGKVLYASGNPPNSQLYDPLTGTWSPTGSCRGCGPGHEEEFTLTLLPSGPAALCGSNCGKVLATGAVGDTGVAFLYDPSTGTWSRTGSMSVPRHAHTATVLANGKVLVAGGCSNGFCVFGFGTTLQSAELYDPLSGTWSPTGAMTEPRWLHSATLIDPNRGPCGTSCGKVLVAFGAGTGDFGETVSTAELYDPATGSWLVTGSSLGTGRLHHDALQLPGGRVMTIAGEGAFFFGAPLDSVEVYDPVGQEWHLSSILNFPRAYPRATLLPSGKVLVVGPSGRFEGGQVDQAEIWSPGDNRWRSATTTAVAHRHSHIGTALLPSGPASVCGVNCGKVLVAGGQGVTGGDPFLAGAELYTPAAQVTGVAPTSGPSGGGTSVTVTGTGVASVTAFPPFTGVRFGTGVSPSVTRDPQSPDTKVVAVSPSGVAGPVNITVTNLAGNSPPAPQFTFQEAVVPTTPTTGTGTGTTGTGTSGTGGAGSGSDGAGSETTGPATALLSGYRLVAADGGVFAFGNLPFLGSTGGIRLAQPVVGTASTPSGRGYWLVASDGGVFAFGDAKFFGSTGAIRLAKPIVGMVATPSGNGYWLVASDGGIFAFGDAKFLGSTGAIRLAQDVVGMAATPTGNGYWLVAKDGGIFAFGDAKFLGSTGAIRLAQQVVGMAASPSGNGYRLVGADGGVFTFGDAGFFGSTGAIRLAQPMVGMASTPSGRGYVLVANDGGVFAFGDARFLGSTGAIRLVQPVVGIATG